MRIRGERAHGGSAALLQGCTVQVQEAEREKINQDLSKCMMPNVLEGQEQNSARKILIRSALTNILNAGLFLVTEYFYTCLGDYS